MANCRPHRRPGSIHGRRFLIDVNMADPPAGGRIAAARVRDTISPMGKRGIKKSRAKKIGRPKTTGSSQPMVVRMHEPRIAAVDVWIKLQNKAISRPEAIRRLVDQGLISFLVRRSARPGRGVEPCAGAEGETAYCQTSACHGREVTALAGFHITRGTYEVRVADGQDVETHPHL